MHKNGTKFFPLIYAAHLTEIQINIYISVYVSKWALNLSAAWSPLFNHELSSTTTTGYVYKYKNLVGSYNQTSTANIVERKQYYVEKL